MDRFEENLGKYTYVTTTELKNYLSINSNTYDSQLESAISYATGVIEHYIGQEILSNTYSEVLDGGNTSVYTSRLPLQEVYQVSEYNGSVYRILNDSSVSGLPNYSESDNVVFTTNNVELTKVKKFGNQSIKLTSTSSAVATIPEHLQFADNNFTIEAFIRVDTANVIDAPFLTFYQDANNYIEIKTLPDYLLQVTTVIGGDTAYVVRGSTPYVESQRFTKRKWAHFAFTRNLDTDKAYLYYDGELIAELAYPFDDLSLTGTITIGGGFVGYIDELRISDIDRYYTSYTAPTKRFRPDDNTLMLLHFEDAKNSSNIVDSHATTSEYSFTRDTGRIDISRSKIPNTSILGNPVFNKYYNAVTIDYKAGYDASDVPLDLKLVTMDLAKMLYKQDQEKKNFSFEGESGDKFALSSNFPPHIKRVLDLYRIIK